ncbi:MAG: hypothetical protein IJ814_06545 [Paludibacteraceae bacterium]|nr:hypothetical protein [Paludibacteraceae bacterium]
MKKITSLILTLLFSAGFICAQDSDNRLNDQQRVALTPVVLDEAIPAGAHKQLVNKMTQMAAKNGCAAVSNSRFVITCSADILTKDITPTAPPMHAYTIALTFFVGDGIEGRLFSSHTVETKGVGPSPEKAYINALKNVRVNDPAFKAMIDKGKQEIVAYYNTYCDIIIADARNQVARHQYTEALDLLAGIPAVCEECYRRAQDESLAAYQAWRDEVCLMALQQAQAAWAKHDAAAAAEALTLIPTDGACLPEAKALQKEIAAKLDAKERQEWEFKMQQYEDQLEAQQQRIAAADSPAARQQIVQSAPAAANSASEHSEKWNTAATTSQPAKPAYQVKGKWFK